MSVLVFVDLMNFVQQAQTKSSDKQLASLTNSRTVNEFIEHEKENIIEVIKQNLAIGDIFKRENLQVKILLRYRSICRFSFLDL